MRPTATFLLVASLLAGSAFAQQPARNPFVPSSAASAPAASKDAPKRDAPVLPRLPNTTPGLYKSPAPFIPPPPAGMQLPTLQLPPPSAAVGEAQGSQPPSGKDTSAPAKDERKSDVFMTREQLQAQRAKCSVTLKTPATLQVSEAGGRQVVKLVVVGGRQCVKGVASSDEWVEASSVSDSGELVLVVLENEGTDERTAEVNIANTGTSITVRIHQAASKEEFRELKL